MTIYYIKTGFLNKNIFKYQSSLNNTIIKHCHKKWYHETKINKLFSPDKERQGGTTIFQLSLWKWVWPYLCLHLFPAVVNGYLRWSFSLVGWATYVQKWGQKMNSSPSHAAVSAKTAISAEATGFGERSERESVIRFQTVSSFESVPTTTYTYKKEALFSRAHWDWSLRNFEILFY